MSKKTKDATEMTAQAVPIKTYSLIVGDNVKVIEDKRSKTRVANFPFEFPDGTRGIVIVCKVKDAPWTPHKDLQSINIYFNE